MFIVLSIIPVSISYIAHIKITAEMSERARQTSSETAISLQLAMAILTSKVKGNKKATGPPLTPVPLTLSNVTAFLN